MRPAPAPAVFFSRQGGRGMGGMQFSH